jgi:hypothetical protein
MPPSYGRRSVDHDPEQQQRVIDDSKRTELVQVPALPADDIAAKRFRRMEAEIERYEAVVARMRADRGLPVDDYVRLEILARKFAVNKETLRLWAVDGKVDARRNGALWEISRSSLAAWVAEHHP